MDHLPSWTNLSTDLKSALSGLSKGVQETQNDDDGDEHYRTVRIKEISAALACHLCEVYIFYMIPLKIFRLTIFLGVKNIPGLKTF